MATPKTPKQHVTSIYIAPEDRKALEKAAKEANLPLTVFIKRVALGLVKMGPGSCTLALKMAAGILQDMGVVTGFTRLK